jgi:hypothetical protein
MNDLSAFDGDAERDRQIVDLRVKGRTEAEVSAMTGASTADIHRALDRAAQAAMTPAARVRGIYLDAAVCPGGKELKKYHRAFSKTREDGLTKDGTLIYVRQ